MTSSSAASTGLRVGSRPRVLHVIKGLTVVGGAERLVLSLATAGDRRRFDYRVAHVLTGPSEHLVEQFRIAGTPIYCLGAASHYDLRWTVRLRNAITTDRIDVVHLHLPYTAALGRLITHSIPISKRPRIVHTQHTPWEHTTLATRVLNGMTYWLDDADLAVSEPTWWSLPRHFRARTEVLVHGVPMDDLPIRSRAREEVRSEFGVQPDEVVIATVANMRKEKAYEVLLGAARLLVQEGLPVRFIAVGHGPLEDQVRQLKDELGLGRRFLLTGFRSDATRIVAGSDLFVLASRYEAFPISVMEALAAGIPVVATAVGDLPRVVGDTGSGLLVPPGDFKALATALRALVVDSERRERMGDCARDVGLAFDIRRAAGRLEEIYGALLARPRRTRFARGVRTPTIGRDG